MGTLFPTFLILISLSLRPSEAWSLPPEDLEASGDDLDPDLEGSGSGEWATGVILDEKSTPLGSSKGNTVLTKSHKSTQNEVKNQEVDPWDRELTIVQESQGFMERKEVLTAVIAGGVCGVVIAALLGGLLIYKWRKKDSLGYVQGHRQEQPSSIVHRGHDVVLV